MINGYLWRQRKDCREAWGPESGPTVSLYRANRAVEIHLSKEKAPVRGLVLVVNVWSAIVGFVVCKPELVGCPVVVAVQVGEV